MLSLCKSVSDIHNDDDTCNAYDYIQSYIYIYIHTYIHTYIHVVLVLSRRQKGCVFVQTRLPIEKKRRAVPVAAACCCGVCLGLGSELATLGQIISLSLSLYIYIYI